MGPLGRKCAVWYRRNLRGWLRNVDGGRVFTIKEDQLSVRSWATLRYYNTKSVRVINHVHHPKYEQEKQRAQPGF